MWKGDKIDRGTVSEISWAGVTISWDSRDKQSVLHNDMLPVTKAKLWGRGRNIDRAAYNLSPQRILHPRSNRPRGWFRTKRSSAASCISCLLDRRRPGRISIPAFHSTGSLPRR